MKVKLWSRRRANKIPIFPSSVTSGSPRTFQGLSVFRELDLGYLDGGSVQSSGSKGIFDGASAEMATVKSMEAGLCGCTLGQLAPSCWAHTSEAPHITQEQPRQWALLHP